MRLILDADALIKLNRAGVLEQVIDTVSCVIPYAVFNEVVVVGKARHYQDADTIESALEGRTQIVSIEDNESELGLGAGEWAILSLISQTPDALVISDDRRFLTVLSLEQIPYLTPVDMIVVLRRRGILSDAEAKDALERIRTVVRSNAYWDAWQDLASLGGSDEKE